MRKEFEENLNPQQLEAVRHTEGPLLVVAGAGSGKTRVITYRMVHLIDQGVPPSKILGLTFTNKAADEMKERVRSMFYPPPPPPLVCTYHSFGARLLRNEIHHLGYSNHFVIYDEDDSLRAIKQAIESLKLKDDFLSPKQVQAAISHTKNEVALDRSLPVRKSSYLTQLRKVTEEYHSLLRKSNALDFDDLILFPLRLFEEYPTVLRFYQDRYRYVLVDEYQDTNAPQYRLVKMLCREHKNICVVGDPDQSIYRWRGSDIRNILNFEKDFPGTRKIVLDQNYRSTTLILEAANSLIRNNAQRTTKNLWSELGEGEEVLYFLADDDKEEAKTVTEIIQQLVENNNLRYCDIAVFYRTHAQSRVIEEYLLGEDIPYMVIGGPGFYGRKEIKDIVAYLRIIASPDDSISLLRIINVPARRIGKTTIDRLLAASRKKGVSLYKIVSNVDSQTDISRSAKTAISSFVQTIEEFREKAKETPLHTLTDELISGINYVEMLKKEFPQDADDRIDNLRELVDTMDSFLTDNPSSGLEEFLERISLVSDIDTWEDKENTVSLMTAHNSKGLEFKAVIIVGLEEGIFPHANSLDDDDPEKLEEERRLCYVGATRAKRHLFITAARERFRHGFYVENEESRFITELFSGRQGREETNADLYVEEDDEQEPAKGQPPQQRGPRVCEFRAGDRIMHPSFGSGKVIAVEDGYTEPFVRVIFEGNGETKLLSPSFAQLRKI